MQTQKQGAPPDKGRNAAEHHTRDLRLSEHEAEAAAPDHASLCGEEDPGSALEFLVQHQSPVQSHKPVR